jgi:hypothetical protein
LEIHAASKAASQNRWRPNEPHHVHRGLVERDSEARRDLLLRPDRRLEARPDLRAAVADVGHGAVGLEGVAGTEVEGEALVERRARERGRERQVGLLKVGEHVVRRFGVD